MLAVSASPTVSVPRRSRSTEQPEAATAPVGVNNVLSSGEDITGMLTSLGRTDFVRKYTRKTPAAGAPRTAACHGFDGVGGVGQANSHTGSSATSPVTESDGDVWVPSSAIDSRPSSMAGPAEQNLQDEEDDRIPSELPTVGPETKTTSAAETEPRSRQSHFRLSAIMADIEPTPITFTAHPADSSLDDVAAEQTGSGNKPTKRPVINLFRSESDSSPVRSFRLRSLRSTAEIGHQQQHQ